MGGIKPHGKGIQVTFYWNGERHRPTLKIPPTATNLKYAERLKAEIERAIALGKYSLEQYAQHFPTSRIARSAPEKNNQLSFRTFSDRWLAASSHLGKRYADQIPASIEFLAGASR